MIQLVAHQTVNPSTQGFAYRECSHRHSCGKRTAATIVVCYIYHVGATFGNIACIPFFSPLPLPFPAPTPSTCPSISNSSYLRSITSSTSSSISTTSCTSHLSIPLHLPLNFLLQLPFYLPFPLPFNILPLLFLPTLLLVLQAF